MNKERLLNVARALRESPAPEAFTMSRYYRFIEGADEHNSTTCSSPACALGHYAWRGDLQDAFSKDAFIRIDYDHIRVLDHFDIDEHEARELFFEGGCGHATSTLEAAEYIEAFVGARS